ncbi:MAG: GuaB3 family IMP dehydrogenase-related protein [SAR202 cluster bacterium]|nr:GuaB3 family IMP dehydrogenase-related protein [SAR202 cluster bacterium]
MAVPQFKEIRKAYGFDDVAISPGVVTINPDSVNREFSINGMTMQMPVLASAMDAIVSPSFAVEFDKRGGLAVMNLEGVQTRYEDPTEVLNRISSASNEDATTVMQDAYSAPIKENLVGDRVREIKSKGAKCAVSITPANTKRLAPLAEEAGADVIVIQSTVTTARHFSKSARGLVFSEFLETVSVPVLVGNCVAYDVALELMETGIDGVLVGVGPGAACTTREVTGVGVPQVTATMDCAAAREEHFRRTGKYVPIITDGGIRTGGDLCKAFASGADAVMIGTPLAQTEEAPGNGFNWGMASPHASLPRGVRVSVGVKGSLDKILFGPTSKTDGTQNLIGALEICMGMVGAADIKGMHKTDVILAPSIKTEGKYFQLGLN